jgi:hypothetical protein
MWKIGIGAVILGLVQVSAATASPVTYTFDGTGAVTLNSVSLGDTFSIVFTGDTSPIDSSGNPLFRYDSIVGTFTDGSVTESMTATLVANADPTQGGRINFFNSTFDNGLGLIASALIGYDLSTSIGPISGTLNPTLGSGSFATADGSLQFTGLNSLSFTAAVTPIPAALPLFASGLGALALLGWRRKRTARSVAG